VQKEEQKCLSQRLCLHLRLRLVHQEQLCLQLFLLQYRQVLPLLALVYLILCVAVWAVCLDLQVEAVVAAARPVAVGARPVAVAASTKKAALSLDERYKHTDCRGYLESEWLCSAKGFCRKPGPFYGTRGEYRGERSSDCT